MVPKRLRAVQVTRKLQQRIAKVSNQKTRGRDPKGDFSKSVTDAFLTAGG
jgi:hypothetical protein